MSDIQSRIMKAHWRDPEYRARQIARMKKRFEDPEERARLRKFASMGGIKRLPPMTESQRLHYKKCKRHGIGREEALKAVMGAT